MKEIYTTDENKQILSQTIYKTLAFNKSLSWDNSYKQIKLATTVDELLEIYKLRSKIYAEIGYNKEYPDKIAGYNFDEDDERSAILYTKSHGHITGTCRLIFDKNGKLPTDKYFSLDYLRGLDKKLAELSRLMICPSASGLGQEFKYLTKGIYMLMSANGITTTVSSMVESHYKWYEKFGGFSIEGYLDNFGQVSTPFIVTSWDSLKISKFFKRVFLNERVA